MQSFIFLSTLLFFAVWVTTALRSAWRRNVSNVFGVYSLLLMADHSRQTAGWKILLQTVINSQDIQAVVKKMTVVIVWVKMSDSVWYRFTLIILAKWP